MSDLALIDLKSLAIGLGLAVMIDTTATTPTTLARCFPTSCSSSTSSTPLPGSSPPLSASSSSSSSSPNTIQVCKPQACHRYVFRSMLQYYSPNESLAHTKGGLVSRVCARKNPEFTPKYIIVAPPWRIFKKNLKNAPQGARGGTPIFFLAIFHLVLP
jgi:hypothetical protein